MSESDRVTLSPLGWAVLALAALVLAIIAYGFEAVGHAFLSVVLFPWRHPHAAWMLVRVAAVIGLSFIGVFAAFAVAQYFYRPSEPPEPVATFPNPYLETRPFGEAEFAAVRQVRDALQGAEYSFRPKFED